MENITCQYTAPQNFAGAAPSSGEPFAFSISNCSTTQATSTASSTIEFTPGEIVISVEIFVIAVCLLFGAVYAYINHQ